MSEKWEKRDKCESCALFREYKEQSGEGECELDIQHVIKPDYIADKKTYGCIYHDEIKTEDKGAK